MILLAIETSSNHGSIALLNNDQLLFSQEFAADRSLGSLLFGPLKAALDQLGGTAQVSFKLGGNDPTQVSYQLEPSDSSQTSRLDQIVVGLGPGSYSGVRIAISAAIGLSVSTGASLLGVSSLAGFPTQAPSYFAIGDARRDTFYFTSVRDRECVEGPLLLSPEELRARLDGIEATGTPVFTSALIEGFPQAQVAFPSAEILARLAAKGKGIISSGDLEPIYLRPPHITMPKAAAFTFGNFGRSK